MVTTGEHYQPTDRDDASVYRVVGTTDGVVLLRVTTPNGRRVPTGEIRRLSPETLDSEFEPTENPDAGLTPIRDARNALTGLYWSVRRLL